MNRAVHMHTFWVIPYNLEEKFFTMDEATTYANILKANLPGVIVRPVSVPCQSQATADRQYQVQIESLSEERINYAAEHYYDYLCDTTRNISRSAVHMAQQK